LHIEPPTFYPFSTNAHPFESGNTYSYFALYAYLEHNGDFVAATKDLVAALAFQALLCDQNVKAPTGIRSNPYIIVVGYSSSGKDKGREIIKKVFTQLVNTPKYKTGRHYKPFYFFLESVASYQALVKRLKRNNGVLLWLWDELGTIRINEYAYIYSILLLIINFIVEYVTSLCPYTFFPKIYPSWGIFTYIYGA